MALATSMGLAAARCRGCTAVIAVRALQLIARCTARHSTACWRARRRTPTLHCTLPAQLAAAAAAAAVQTMPRARMLLAITAQRCCKYCALQP